jgi:hypothetical protein
VNSPGWSVDFADGPEDFAGGSADFANGGGAKAGGVAEPMLPGIGVAGGGLIGAKS